MHPRAAAAVSAVSEMQAVRNALSRTVARVPAAARSMAGGASTGGKTPPYKRAVVAKLLWKYPQVSKVTLYEDTQENIDVVEALCQKKGVEFEGKLIRVDPYPLPEISKEEYMTFLENHLAQDELTLIKKKL